MVNVKSIFDKEKYDLPIKEIMSKQVITVLPSTSADVCAKLMIENKIGSLVVVDDSEKILGIITKENLIKYVIAQNAPAEKVKAFEMMTTPVITALQSLKLVEAVQKMFKEGIRHLAITDAENRLIGMCTDTDVFKVIPQIMFLEQEYLKFVNREETTTKKVEEVSGYCDSCEEFSEELIQNDDLYICPNCLPEGYKETEIEDE